MSEDTGAWGVFERPCQIRGPELLRFRSFEKKVIQVCFPCYLTLRRSTTSRFRFPRLGLEAKAPANKYFKASLRGTFSHGCRYSPPALPEGARADNSSHQAALFGFHTDFRPGADQLSKAVLPYRVALVVTGLTNSSSKQPGSLSAQDDLGSLTNLGPQNLVHSRWGEPVPSVTHGTLTLRQQNLLKV